MKNKAKKIVSLFLALVMLCGIAPVSSVNAAGDTESSVIAATKSENDFVLAESGQAATLWVDSAEEQPVIRVVSDLKNDIKSVTGIEAVISNDDTVDGPVVIVGTLDKSSKIQDLVANGTITAEEKAAIEGQWEAYLIKVVDKNTLVIAGSDNRGAIYGVYQISEEIGVSPWHYFGDVPAQTKSEVYIPAGTVLTDKPDVQYRGLFINDEEKLYQWVCENLDPEDRNTFGPEFYEKLFELILRLGGNYFWPAMHMVGFNMTEENIPVLQKYGVVFGTSHCDMLARTNKHEWVPWSQEKGYNYTMADWDYTTHRTEMIEYWTEGVQRHKDSDVQWTVGLRGNSDEPMNTANLDVFRQEGDSDEDAKTRLMIQAMEDQYQILQDVLGVEEAEKALKVLVPYKEVLPLYQNQIFQDWMNSDDSFEFTTMWCNDNHGMVRNLPNEAERKREGGNALYYHFSYWAPKDQSYMWMSSVPLSTIGEELNKSWESGIQKLWIVNVGDLKPAEGELDYFMRCAWDVDYTTNSVDFSTEWALENFGSDLSLEAADEVADILNTFYHHSNVRKVEQMRLDVFEQMNFNEWDKRMATSADLFARAQAIADSLSSQAAKDAFYELVQSKINWTYYTNKMFYYADKSNVAYDQGKMASADTFSELSIAADAERKTEIEKYSTIVDGKWDGFIDPENYDVGKNATTSFSGPPVTSQNPATNPALVLGATEMGVIIQGETMPTTDASAMSFSRYNQDAKFIDIFNKGAGSFAWTATTDVSWITLSKTSGTVCDEERAWITVNDFDAATDQTGTITITAGEVTKTITVTVENVAAGITGRYVEADGYVSMQAEHYTAKTDAGNKTWEFMENLGRGYDGDMMRSYDADLGFVDESNISASSSPSLSYDFYLTSSGTFDLEVYRLPTLNATGQVRFAVSVDGGAPIVISSTATDEGTSDAQNPQWAENLYHQIEKHVVTLPNLTAGNHTLKLWMVDNYISIDKLVIYTNGIPKSELGPDESYHSVYNNTFTGAVNVLDRDSVERAEKDIPSTWGSGNFLESGGKVSIEAEYAMENIVTSSNEVTADMSAVAISHEDIDLTGTAVSSHNAWQFTQSDTGYGVYSPDLGQEWPTSNPNFRAASPELRYKINFVTAGWYYVWARVRTVDYDSEGFYYSEDGSYFGGWRSDYWTHPTDEKWTWVKISTRNDNRFYVEEANSTHTYHIWMREEGIYIDRIYMTLDANDVPTDDSWTPSLRADSVTSTSDFKTRLQLLKDEINKYSYPIGTGAGCYSEEKYNALLDTITAADELAKLDEIQAQAANDAIAAIEKAYQALKDSQNMTENDKTYLFYRDFESETELGKYPYGFGTYALNNGGAYSVMEEDGNSFLRLTTSTAAGSSQLIAPYTVSGLSKNEYVVVEFSARMVNKNIQDANMWIAMNGTAHPTATTMMFNVPQKPEDQADVLVKPDATNWTRVGRATYNTWHRYKVIVNMVTHTYDVYMDDDGVPLVSGYDFRDATVNELTGHRFGINGKANGTVDFDDFKVSIKVDEAMSTNLATSEINLRDPFVLAYEGRYYMYGTRQNVDGFDVYVSKDLETWTEAKQVYANTEQTDLWAPEVHQYNGKFYMFASYKGREEDAKHGTAIFVSDTPDGTFVPHSDGAVTPADWNCLDGTLYVEDGTPYMVFSHEWIDNDGEGTICAIQLSQDLKTAVSEPTVLWSAKDAAWVGDGSSADTGTQYVTDGPDLISYNGELIALWSSFDKNGNYVVAVSRSDNGKVAGTWTIDDTPLYSGGGHGTIFQTFSNRAYKIVYHSPNIPAGMERPVFDDLDMATLVPSS